MNSHLLTKKEVAHLCGASTRTVDRWIACGWLAVIRCGKRFVRFRGGDVERFIQLHLRAPKGTQS